MDIDLLSKMVKELILDNDRVVLPGLGAFVAEIVPSTFSDKGYTINPPYRRMYFRSKPNDGDELAVLYAKGNNIDKVVAERIIRDFVTELKFTLHGKKTVVFPGLGRLRATRENAVFFVADEDLDIYPDGFGLEPISLKTHQETKEEVAAAVEDLKSLLIEQEAVQEIVPEPEEPEIIEESEEVLEIQETTVQEEPEVPEIEPVEIIAEDEKPEIEEEIHEIEGGRAEIDDAESEGEKDTLDDRQEIVQEAVPIEPARKPAGVGKVLLIIFLIILALALLFLAAVATVGRTNPEWIDQYLYTQEEMKILNHIL